MIYYFANNTYRKRSIDRQSMMDYQAQQQHHKHLSESNNMQVSEANMQLSESTYKNLSESNNKHLSESNHMQVSEVSESKTNSKLFVHSYVKFIR